MYEKLDFWILLKQSLCVCVKCSKDKLLDHAEGMSLYYLGSY